MITDQKSVSFMFDNRKRSKIKNSKIQSWRLELAEFSYAIQYWEGKDNVVPDSFTRAHCAAVSTSMEEIHAQLCHPGVTRLLHFVKAKDRSFSTQDVRDVCSNCRICAELKPKFYQSQNSKLVKATRPMERLIIDFMGPLPSSSRNKYFLTVVDEYSRFPCAIPCPNVAPETVTWKCCFPFVGCLNSFTLIVALLSCLKNSSTVLEAEVLPAAVALPIIPPATHK